MSNTEYKQLLASMKKALEEAQQPHNQQRPLIYCIGNKGYFNLK